jgi:DNA-binding transcriptional MerR regulator
MKLRRYNQFINESVEITGDLLEILKERGKFWNEILELDYSKFDFTSSYSDMCKRTNRNPEEDFQKIQKHFDEKGFSLEEIKDLFSEENNMRCGYNLEEFYKSLRDPINREPFKSISSNLKEMNKDFKLPYIDYDTILRPFSTLSTLGSQGAIQDFYLYKLFEKLGLNANIVKLGGDGWGDIDGWENGGDYSEAFIRYRYGYHQTEYGKLWMKQCQIDEEWLKEEAMGDLQKYIEEEFSSICSRILYSISFKDPIKQSLGIDNMLTREEIRGLIRQFKLDDFSIVEEDRIIIDIDKLCLEILKLNGIEEVKHSDIESAVAEFTKQMEGFSLDIELTDTDDLIIWGRFKED